MRAVIQRVSSASVRVDGELIGSAGRGFLVLLGVMEGDSEKQAEFLAGSKCFARRISDGSGK